MVRFGPTAKLMVSNETNDASSQFHQHFMSNFLSNILLPNNYKAKLLAERSCKKHFCTIKLFVKCVNFTNILWATYLWESVLHSFFWTAWLCNYLRKKLAQKLLIKWWWKWLQAGPLKESKCAWRVGLIEESGNHLWYLLSYLVSNNYVIHEIFKGVIKGSDKHEGWWMKHWNIAPKLLN